MSPLQLWLAFIGPIIAAVVAGFFAYSQAKRVADRNAKTETDKTNLALYDSLNRGLAQEVEKLRADRAEDEDRHERSMAKVIERLEELAEQRTSDQQRIAELEARISRIAAWARDVWYVVNHPDVQVALNERAIEIPPPPVKFEDGGR